MVSKALINSVISHDEFVSINNVLKEYDEMKEEIKNLKIQRVHRRFYSIHKRMLSNCLKCRKNKES